MANLVWRSKAGMIASVAAAITVVTRSLGRAKSRGIAPSRHCKGARSMVYDYDYSRYVLSTVTLLQLIFTDGHAASKYDLRCTPLAQHYNTSVV